MSEKGKKESLAVSHPELAAEALFDATTVTQGSNKKVPWRCAEGHEWEAVIASRARGNGCPFCSGHRVLPGTNDLLTTDPNLASEAMFDPTTVSQGSEKKVPWRCAEGHEWEATVKGRTRGDACPYCSGRRVLPGFNDLVTTDPDLASEALFDPTAVTRGANRKVPWRCMRGHEWEAVIADRARGNGCPYCSNRQIFPGFNDLATTHPVLASEALFDATKVSFGSSAKKIWRCAEGHEWAATTASRATGGGCPVCLGRRVLPGFNDLATTDPDLATEALFDPTTVTQGSGKKAPWRCVRGHEWEATIASRAKGVGCPFCSGNRVLPGFNDLATLHPELAKEALFDATKVTTGTNKKGKWRCAEGHEWAAIIGDRVRGIGCPNCAQFGFHPERRAWLYLMHHDQWEMLQIGITNNPVIREQQHRRDGWTLIDIRGPMDGVLTQTLERDILRFLKHEAKVTLSTSRRSQYEGKLGQRGEAWPIDQYRPQSLAALVTATIEWGEREP
jgi:hypothetical protein